MIGNDTNDSVNHPSHYVAGKFEVIEIIEAFELDFSLGNTIKYILRAGKKGGESTALEDLQKAQWYLEHTIRKRSPKRQITHGALNPPRKHKL